MFANKKLKFYNSKQGLDFTSLPNQMALNKLQCENKLEYQCGTNSSS